jgi:hypothetical protein
MFSQILAHINVLVRVPVLVHQSISGNLDVLRDPNRACIIGDRVGSMSPTGENGWLDSGSNMKSGPVEPRLGETERLRTVKWWSDFDSPSLCSTTSHHCSTVTRSEAQKVHLHR